MLARPAMIKVGAYLVLLLAFVLRVYRLGHQSIWWDEGYSIAISSSSLGELTKAAASDIHPPLYYYLLHFWMPLAGQSEFSVRFLSVVMSVLLVALLWSFGARLLGPRLATVGALLAAISPLYVAYAQEARMYTLETLLGMGSAYILFLLLKGKASPRWFWAAYVLVTVMALYADYFSAGVLVFENVFVLGWVAYNWRRGKPAAAGFMARWLLSQIALLLLYAPWLGIALGQVTGYGFGAITAPPLGSLPADIWHVLALGSQISLPTDAPLLYIVGAILMVGLFLRFLKEHQGREGNFPTVYLLSYLLVPLAGFVLALQFRPLYHPRYFLVATPPYYLLLAAALGGLWALWRGLGALGWVGLVSASALVLHAYYFDASFSKDDARSTIAFVEKEAEEDDLVLWVIPYPFQYYYRGKAPTQFLRVDPVNTAEELSKLSAGRKRIFWLTWRQSDLDPWQLVPFLLGKHGNKLGERDFIGYKVLWYSVPPQAVYHVPQLEDREVNFEDTFLLTGLRVEWKGELSSGEALWLTLSWRCLKKPSEDLKVYVHIKDGKGRIVGQDDRFLYNMRRVTTRFWKEGDVAFTFAAPVIRPGMPPGEYKVEIGLYSEKTWRRPPVVDGSDPVLVGSIRVGR